MEFTFQNDYGVDYWLERANTIGELMEECFSEPDAQDQMFTDFVSMFEAEETAASENKEDSKAKETMKKGFFASLKNAYDAMIKKLKELVSKIKNFFKEKFASAELKRQIKELQAEIDANPELKGIKVTVDDYEKIKRIYDTAEKDAGVALQRAIKESQDPTEFTATLNKIDDYVKKGVPTAVKGIGLAAAAAAAAMFAGVVNEAIGAANEQLGNLEKTAANLGKGSGNEHTARLTAVFDRFVSKWRGEKTKKTSGGFTKLMKDILSAARPAAGKGARKRLAARALKDDGIAGRAVRSAAAAGLNVASKIDDHRYKSSKKK